jgi:pyruvate decarboxylase
MSGYAADGYARVKGISTLFTTFGVGELSALNAMAGAYAEYVPIVHLVGAPSILSQRGRAALHHTLGDGRYRVFEDMSRQISCAAAVLDDVDTAPGMIDEAIRRCLVESRPAYISIPTDMVQKQIEGTHLEKPIDMAPPVHDTSDEENALEAIFKLISTAHKPAILVDGGAKRGKVSGCLVY